MAMISSSKKKNVLFVVDKSGFGGVQTIAYALMQHGVPETQLTFCFLRNVNDRFQMDDVLKENVIYLKSNKKYGIASFFELRRLLGKGRFDILHLNGNKAIIFGVFLKLMRGGFALVAHDHGGVYDYKSWYVFFLRLSRKLIDRYVCVSNYRGNYIQSRCAFDPAKIAVINNFVDESKISRSKVAPEKSAAGSGQATRGDFVIGYIGGLSRIKGCDVLLRAVAILRRRIGGFRVMIAGDGPARTELEAMAAELGVADLVSFLGYASEPAKVYADFDLMVIPSRAEEGPICLYEAWQMQVPVVASNAPVLNERIRDYETGLFFVSEDPDSLAEKIREAYEDEPLRNHLVSESFRHIEDYSFRTFNSKLQSLYAAL